MFKKKVQKGIIFIGRNKLLMLRLAFMAMIILHSTTAVTHASSIAGVEIQSEFSSSGSEYSMPWDSPIKRIAGSLLGPVPRVLCLLGFVSAIITWWLGESQFAQKAFKGLIAFSLIMGIVSVYGWFTSVSSGCVF